MVKVTWFQIPGAGFEVGGNEEENFVGEVEEGHIRLKVEGGMVTEMMIVIKEGMMEIDI